MHKPLLFLLYMSELFDIVAEFGFTSHAYADDTQLYISIPAVSYQEATERFFCCLEQVRNWMASNQLKLNEDKTQIIWLGTRNQLSQILTDFQNFCTAGKRMKFATKPVWHCSPHYRNIATLPWKIKNSNFLQIFSNNTRYVRKCKQTAWF